MLKNFRLLYLGILFLLFSQNVSAGGPVLKRTVASGNWSNPAIWNPAGVPGNLDDVEIRHNVSTGAVSLRREFTVFPGATLSASGTLDIRGNMTVNGTITTSGGAAVNLFQGSSNISGTGVINGALSASNTNTFLATCSLTINGNITIANNSTLINNGIVTVNGNIIGSGGSATWTNNIGSTLNVSGDLLVTGALTSTAIPNTVNYFGTTNRNIKAVPYHNLIITKGIRTATLTGLTSVAGNLTVTSGILGLTGFDFTVFGISSVTGRINVTSASGIRTFNDLTINSGGVWNAAVPAAVTINGNLTNNGIFASSTGIYTLAGTAKTISGSSALSIANITCSGSYTNNANLTISTTLIGGGSFTNGVNAFLTFGAASIGVTMFNASNTGNTVTYNGTGAQNVRLPEASIYHHLSFTNASVKSLSGNIIINGNLSITASTLDVTASNYTINLKGNWNNSGIFLPGASTVFFTGTTTMSGTAITSFYNVNITGTLTAYSGNMNVARDFSNSGIFNHNNGTVTFTGVTNLIGTFITSFNNVTTTGSFTAHATLNTNVAGNWVNTGTFNHNGSTITFNSSNTQTITNAAGESFFNIVISSLTKTTLNTNLTVWGTITINTTLDVSASNFRIDVKGNWVNAGTFMPQTGTVYFNGSTNQSFSGANTFYNLEINSAGTVSILGNPQIIQKDLNIVTGTLAATTQNILIAGNWINNSVFNPGTATVTFNGTAAQSIYHPSTESFNNITVSNAAGVTLGCHLAVAQNITITGTLNVSALNYNITILGNWSNTGTFNPALANVNFNGTAGQSIAGSSVFYNLNLNNPSTVTLTSGVQTIQNDLSINAGTLNANNNNIIIGGDWLNTGLFTSGTNTVTFNGTAGQVITGVNTFYNLTINANSVAINANQNLVGGLTLTSGTFTTTGFVFTLLSTSTGTAYIAPITGGAYVGNIVMQRYIASGPTSWRFLAAPVTSRTLADWRDDFIMTGFTGSQYPSFSFNSVNTYNEAAAGTLENGYVPATNITNSITPGTGYWVYVDGASAFTLDVTGPPVTGTQSLPVSYTANAGAAHDGWNMIGNPYPSTIDWNSAGWTKTNLYNAIYIWNPSSQQYTSYVGGIGTNGGSRYVPSSQAFWVQSASASPALIATESVKASVNQAFRNDSLPNMISLSIKGNTVYADETVIRFDNSAALAFEGEFDAVKMYSLNSAVPNVSSVLDSIEYSINTLALGNSGKAIPVKVTATSGTYTLSANLDNLLYGSSCVLLEDLFNDSVINLRVNPTYTFNFSDTTLTARFILHVTEPVIKERTHITCNGASTGVAIAKGTGSGPWNYTWKNASGTVLKTSTSSSADTLLNISAGTYYFTITGGVCAEINDTIIIEEVPGALSTNVTAVSPVCNNTSDGSINISDLRGGVGPYNVMWNTGNSGTALSGLSGGSYSYTVIDANGCVFEDTITLTAPQPVSATVNISNPSCSYSTDGNLSIASVNGTSGAYDILWSNGETSSTIVSLPSGEYFYTITDANGCSSYNTITLESSVGEIAAFFTCMDTIILTPGTGTQFINNSTGAVNYTWNFNDGTAADTSASPLHVFPGAGEYSISLSAANGICEDTYSCTVNVVNGPGPGPGTSVKENDLNNSVNIYNNGNGLHCSFNLDKSYDATINVFNLIGQQIASKSVASVINQTVDVTMPVHAFGVYLVEVRVGAQRLTRRVTL